MIVSGQNITLACSFGPAAHAGAKSFGFRTYWINRAGAALDALDATPDHTISRLTELVALVG